MPFDPARPNEFRLHLKELITKEHCSAEDIIEITNKHLTAAGSTKLDISVATLNRFIAGTGGHTKVVELRAISHALEKHPTYKKYFHILHHVTASATPEVPGDAFEAFLMGMTQLFSEIGRINASFPLDGPARIGDRLVGFYAFYRPSWRPYVKNSR